MPTIYEIVFKQQKEVLEKIEDIYGPLKIKPKKKRKRKRYITNSLLDDPELQELDKLMREVPGFYRD